MARELFAAERDTAKEQLKAAEDWVARHAYIPRTDMHRTLHSCFQSTCVHYCIHSLCWLLTPCRHSESLPCVKNFLTHQAEHAVPWDGGAAAPDDPCPICLEPFTGCGPISIHCG